MEPEERVVADPGICGGHPTIRGTRVLVQSVLELLAAGDPIDEILSDYPQITREDVLACIAYAMRLVPGASERLSPAAVRDELDRIYPTENSSVAPGLAALQSRALVPEEW